ncbi:TonB-dependent receptor [Emticicia aquatilis]|uniref:TonB-dependent receptor n=1 Tax=Emticicia aquatilis TaxID=1537369 RepID=A0A917DJ55_9BACT|nr:TonB-dependent receptor [Emticicia aquatilis]GGD42797.1 TonB-dependent receptor [Emticicia aquatilis]
MIKKIQVVLVLFSILSHTIFAQRTFTVSGYIREKGSQEQLIGVNVYVPNSSFGTSSNNYGFYSITLPANDAATLVFSFVGYERIEKTFVLNKNIEMNIELASANQLNEVVVSSKRQEERVSESVEMSKIDVPINQIKKIPAFMGEKDVLKVLQLLPGVQKGSEGQSGIYVRGGGPDQNLIILDDAVVYNANHLFGFFSVFNGDALKSVELTKGGFPARFGGRLSSVIEMNMKEGNKEKLHGEGGIGLISSRLTLEGPIKTKKQETAKSSFIISARRTYLDIVASPLIKASQKDAIEQTTGGYYFYDLNAKMNYDFGQKDKVYLSGYFGQDKFHTKTTSPDNLSSNGLNWGNETATLRWNHLYSQKLFGNLSLIYSRYRFNISSTQNATDTQTNTTSVYNLKYDSGIRDYSVKYDFDYFPNPKHALKLGIQSTFHRFTPSAVVLQDSDISKYETKIDNIDVIESGIYAEDVWQATERLKMNLGLRVSNYHVSSIDYLRPEPRFSAAYKLSKDLAFKASYAMMNQYVHLLTNTGIGLPTDLWVPSTDKVAPQQSQQVAAGFAKDLDKKGLTLTIEGYYKKMDKLINYKEGASFLLVNDPTSNTRVRWEDNVTAGQGWSYGAEFLLQKKVGKFSGWAGYTLSWTKWQFDELNFGKEFFPRYDRRHDISLVGIYDIKPSITVSAVWVYGTGNALTMPLSRYNGYSNYNTRFGANNAINNSNTPVSPLFAGRAVQEYGEKNTFRAEPYHRLDLGVQFHKKKLRHERTWEISIYNAYNRKNPFFYQLNSKVDPSNSSQSITILQRYSIFPIIPSFSYNFKF